MWKYDAFVPLFPGLLRGFFFLTQLKYGYGMIEIENQIELLVRNDRYTNVWANGMSSK